LDYVSTAKVKSVLRGNYRGRGTSERGEAGVTRKLFLLIDLMTFTIHMIA